MKANKWQQAYHCGQTVTALQIVTLWLIIGIYKYFKYPLTDLIQTVRRVIYPKLAPVANAWMKMLNMESQFPDEFDELQRLCHDNNQTKPTVIILKYGKGGHDTLYQDLYGGIFFLFSWFSS